MNQHPDAAAPETRGARQRRLRSGARFHAVQALFQMEAAGLSADQIQRDYLGWRLGRIAELADEAAPEADEGLFAALLDDAVTWQARIDQMTDRAIVARWSLTRIDPVLRAIFRAAGAELIGHPSTPPKVVITEYLRLAQGYFGEGVEGRFVNAVLDHMAREVRPEVF